MAEPVGTTLGALGVLGLLSVCIDSFNFIEDGRSVGKAFTLLRGQFANLRFRLLVWCRACKFFDEGGYDARLNHPELRPQILAQLNSICLLFMDAKKVIGKYDVPASSTQLSTPGSSALFVEEGLHDFLKRIKKTKSRAGFRGAFLWALKDKRAFEELIERLENCISALELVTASLDMFTEPHVRRAIEIEIETLSDVEVLSHMVANSDSSQSSAVISDVASQRILSLRSRSSSHEHSTASTDSQTFYTAHTLYGAHPMESIAEESAFSCFNVDNAALHEALWHFSQRIRNKYGALFIGWLLEAGHGTVEANLLTIAEVRLDAPTSYYGDSRPITPNPEDSTETSDSELNAQPSTGKINTLSNDLLKISLAVQETVWDLRSEFRNKVEHSECNKDVLNLLKAAYLKLPAIVLVASDGLIGRLPALEVLRQKLSAPPDTYDDSIRELISRHTLPVINYRRISDNLDRVSLLGSPRGAEMDIPGVDRPLSILSGYLDPEVLAHLLKERPFGDHGEEILIRVLAFRLAATACVWALIGLLESRPPRRIKRWWNESYETLDRIDEHEWDRRLLDIKREDQKRNMQWTSRCTESIGSSKLVEEAVRVAGQYPNMSLRLLHLDEESKEAIVTFEAPQQSSYATGIFQICVTYDNKYGDILAYPTKVRFLTKLYHPNIVGDQAGKACSDFLNEYCEYSNSIASTVKGICALLDNPQTDDPLVPEIAETYINDRDEYTRCAKLYTERYATLEAAVQRLAEQDAQHEASREALWDWSWETQQEQTASDQEVTAM